MKKAPIQRLGHQALLMRPRLIMQPLLQARWALLPAAVLLPLVAMANPTGGTVVAGQASITGGAGLTTIQQQSASAVINWQQFGIGSGETVNFIQPSASAAILNRVIGGDASAILGNLTSNGRVFLVNPQGVMFGSGARIDVGSLVASTLDIRKEDFMAGRYVLAGNNSPAGVSNEGVITARDGGFVVLSGGDVSNGGLIQTRLGEVVLASGAGLTLDLNDTGLISYRIDAAALNDVAGVTNTGSLMADGGRVFMAANVARNLAATAVNNSGSVRATSIGEQDGVIVLEALGGNTVSSGTLTATSERGTGGAIQVLGNQDVLVTGGTVDASGATGGGVIRIGGGWQGGEGLVAAQRSYVGPQAVLRADALDNGQGGNIAVWSSQHSNVAGRIAAQGAGSGRGGDVETSSHGYLAVARAPQIAGSLLGGGGRWLIDPRNLTIFDDSQSQPPPAGGQSGGVFTSDTDDAMLGVSLIEQALANNGSVAVLTGDDGNQPGTLTLATDLDYSGTGSGFLTFEADGDLIINGNITGATGNRLALTLRAGGNIEIGSNFSTINLQGSDFSATTTALSGGDIRILGNASITTGGGDIEIGAARDVQIGGDVTSSGGDLKIRASVGQDLDSVIGSITQFSTSDISLGGGNLDLGKTPDGQHSDFGALGNILLQGSILGANNVNLSTGDLGGGLQIDAAPNQGNLSTTGSIEVYTGNSALTISRDLITNGSISLSAFGLSADIVTVNINAGNFVQLLALDSISTGAIDIRSAGPGGSLASLLLGAGSDITVNGTISTSASTTQGGAVTGGGATAVACDGPCVTSASVDAADASVYIFTSVGNITIGGDINTAATVTATPLLAGETPTTSTNVAQANASVLILNGDTANQSIVIATEGIHTSAIAYGAPSVSIEGDLDATSANAAVEIRTDYLNDETPNSFSGTITAGGSNGITTLTDLSAGGISDGNITAVVLGGGITINGPMQTSADGYVDLLTRSSTTQPPATPPSTVLPPPVLAHAAGDIILNGAVGNETLAPQSVRIESGAGLRFGDIRGGTVSLSSVGDMTSSTADGHLSVTSLTSNAPAGADSSNTGIVTIQANNGNGKVRANSITIESANRLITSGLFDTTQRDATGAVIPGFGTLTITAADGTARISMDTTSTGDVSFRDDAGDFIGSVDFATGNLSVTAAAIDNSDLAIDIAGSLELETTVGTLTTAAVTTAGNLQLDSFSGIQTGALQGSNLDVRSGDTGGITTEDITATSGDIVLFAPVSGGPALNIDLGNLRAASGSVTVFAGGLNSTTDIASITAGGSVEVDTFDSGDFYALTTIGAIESGGDVNVGTLLATHVVNLTTVAAAGSINVRGGNAVTANLLSSTGGGLDVSSGGDITVGGLSSDTDGAISLTSTAGNITATGEYSTLGDLQLRAENGTITLDNSRIEGNLAYLSADTIAATEAINIEVAALTAAGRILDFSGANIVVGQGAAPLSNDFGLIAELTQQGLPLPSSLIPNASFDATEALTLSTISGTAQYIALRAPVASLPNLGSISSTASDLFLQYAPTDNAADFIFDLAQLSFANNAATFAFGSADYSGSIFITDPSTGIVQTADKALTANGNNTNYILLSQGSTFGESTLQAATTGRVAVLGPDAPPPAPPPPSPAPPSPAPAADPLEGVMEQNRVLLTDQLSTTDEKEEEALSEGPETALVQNETLVTRDSAEQASQQCDAI